MKSILPIICYRNLFETGTVTTDGSDKENAYDWLTHDAWTTNDPTSYLRVNMGSSTACDYMAIAGHDIFTQTASVKLQHGPNGADWTDVAETVLTPTDNDVIIIPFPAISAQWWQVYLSGLDAAASIAVVSIGERLTLQRGCQAGFVPPSMARADKILNSRTQDGAFLGRSLIRTGARGSIQLAHLSESWVRLHLDDFITHARTKGWFLLWNESAQPSETVYCWSSKTSQPSFEAPGRMQVSIDYEGITS